MSYKPYPEYKQSGIEWIGEIPEHWEFKKLKYLLKNNKDAVKTGHFGSQLKNNEMLNGEIKVYNQRTVLDNDFDKGEYYISKEKYEELKSFTVYPKDILITTRGTIGKASILPLSSQVGILHPCLIRIQIKLDITSNDYLIHLINDTDILLEQVNLLSNSTTIEVIYSNNLKELILPLPPSPSNALLRSFSIKRLKRLMNSLAVLNIKLRS